MKRLTRNLRNNSIEAFVLALETVNRPSVKYRMESFCFLFCNAWELLMKAKLLNEGDKIFYKKKYRKPRRSLSLDDCLNRIFTSENDPIKLNIKAIHELRNTATHLAIPLIPTDIMGLFQAGVLNYPKMLQEWFGISLSDRVPLGMMSLVYDFDPTEYSLEHPKMRRKMSAETVRWLTSFQQDIRSQATSLGNTVMQFYIPIDLKLAIVKNPSKADIVLSSSTTADQEALILEVPKDVDKTHPYRSKDVEALVSARLADKPPFNRYDILCIRKIYNIKSRAEFYYKSKFWTPRYSELFVEWIVKQATKHPDFFRRVRARYKKQKEKQQEQKE